MCPPPDDLAAVNGFLVAEGLEPLREGSSGIDEFWPALEHIRRQGLIVLIKLDGERESLGYAAVISGPPLNDEFFRRDAATVEDALISTLAGLARFRAGS